MLKIYHAYNKEGSIKIDDFILFRENVYPNKPRVFDTGLDGFGMVTSGNSRISQANYEFEKLAYFRDYVRSINTEDGYPNDFQLLNPVSYQILEDTYGDISKDVDTFELYGLEEEAVLLFTKYIHMTYPSDGSVEKIFGRNPLNGMYLILPNASFDMAVKRYNFDGKYCGEYSLITENYELLQSQSLGKRLSLTKMNRRI